MKILDFAIDVERAERDLYQRLANCSDSEGLRSIFQMIAADEGKLLKRLRELKENPENGSIELESAPDLPAKLRKEQNGSCELLDRYHVNDDVSGYSYIQQTERLLLNLYTNLRERETSSEAKNLLNLILREKKEEIERVHMIYNFVNAPNEYMVWSEFSNLGEFHKYGRDLD